MFGGKLFRQPATACSIRLSRDNMDGIRTKISHCIEVWLNLGYNIGIRQIGTLSIIHKNERKDRLQMSKGKDKGFIAEFRKFITRGNVMDMAVGVIVGGAFTAIVTSLNQDILTPILAVFGGTDFSYLTVALGKGEDAPVLNYGNFITAIINFLITALVIFLLVKLINKVSDRLSHKEEEKPAAASTKKCPFCKSEIAIDATRCPHCTSKLDEEQQ